MGLGVGVGVGLGIVARAFSMSGTHSCRRVLNPSAIPSSKP